MTSQQQQKATSTGISETDILNARSALKPSRSFPNELNDNDNSSSGVSSDQEQPKVMSTGTKHGVVNNPQTTKFVTYLPVESSIPSTIQIGKKSYDSESSESSEKEFVSMKKMLHPKLQVNYTV